MENMREIVILNGEARRQGTSYGKFVSRLSAAERDEVLRKRQHDGEGAGKRKKKRSAAERRREYGVQGVTEKHSAAK